MSVEKPRAEDDCEHPEELSKHSKKIICNPKNKVHGENHTHRMEFITHYKDSTDSSEASTRRKTRRTRQVDSFSEIPSSIETLTLHYGNRTYNIEQLAVAATEYRGRIDGDTNIGPVGKAELLKSALEIFTDSEPTGSLTFHYYCLPQAACKLILDLPVPSPSRWNIEFRNDYFNYSDGGCFVMFANACIGGGITGHGLVQEEVAFIMCPELLAAVALEKHANTFNENMIMATNEAVVIEGIHRRVDTNSIYRKISPDQLLQVKADYSPKACTFIEIDALKMARGTHYDRAELKHTFRKAILGFAGAKHRGVDVVHTGEWGCGVFYNNYTLMRLVQCIAAALAGVKLIYHEPAGNKVNDAWIEKFFKALPEDTTIGTVIDLLEDQIQAQGGNGDPLPEICD